jgi:xanthine dehydrogenase iron-sulfur cluster and FAD-binding subunit A
MLMAAKALLNTNPRPSRDQVIEAISGNLCRCTGYEPIIAAILDVPRGRKTGAMSGTLTDQPIIDFRKEFFADERDDNLTKWANQPGGRIWSCDGTLALLR